MELELELELELEGQKQPSREGGWGKKTVDGTEIVKVCQ